jgi:hypothetical protein
MKRFLALILLLQICLITGLAAQSALPVRSLDYLIVVDTSYSMSRLDDQVLSWVHDLVISGFGGRIQPNQSYAIWTFNEKVNTRLFSPKIWSPELNRLLAADSVRYLKAQRFEKQTYLNEAIHEIKNAVAAHPDLIVFLISDGKERLQGTPFDQQITAACVDVVPRFGRARRPLILTFVCRESQFVAWSLTLAGNPVQFPDLSFLEDRKQRQPGSGSTDVPAAAKPQEVVSATAQQPTPPPVLTPAVSLPVAVASKPAETKEEPIAVPSVVPSESKPAPLVPQVTVPAEEPRSVVAPPAMIIQPEQQSPSNTAKATEPSTSNFPTTSTAGIAPTPVPAVVLNTPSVSVESVTPVPDAKNKETPEIASASKPMESSDVPSSPPPPVETKSDTTLSLSNADSNSSATRAVQPAQAETEPASLPASSMTQPISIPSRTKPAPGPNALVSPFPADTGGRSSGMVIVGAVFLVSAILVFWVYLRRNRGPRSPSLISQSLDRKP